MKTIVAVAVMMMLPALSSAQINKCVDKSGKVVGYGNECPAGTRSEASGVKSSPAPAAAESAKGAAPGPQKSLAERDAEFRKRQVEKQEADAKAAKTAAADEQNRSACEASRNYLKALQSGQRITRTDPKSGERIYLDDSEYPKETARVQQQIQANCK
jgi:hypothetical protein